MMAIDLTTVDGAAKYLKECTSFEADDVQILSGGYINFVWRARLKLPYEGHKSIILKHPEPYAANDKSLKFDVARQAFEYEALQMVLESGLLSGDSLVTVPTILKYDTEYRVLVMEDAGTIPTLQDLLSSQMPPPSDITTLIATELAEFIAKLHQFGRGNETARLKLSGNMPARSGYCVEYGNVVPMAAAYGVNDSLLQRTVGMLTEEAMTSEETLIMGDFWFGNILVDIQDKPDGSRVLKKIWVVDWDMCRYGSPASDIATIAGDSFLISRFKNPSAGDIFRHKYLSTYASLATIDAARVVVGMGTHWIMFTKILEWSTEEETRECIERGVEYIHKGWEKSLEWIGTVSLARELIG